MLEQGSQLELDSVLRKSVSKYVEESLRVIELMFQTAPSQVNEGESRLGPQPKGSVHFSIMFTGVVFGEYILSMDRELALEFARKVDPTISSELSFENSSQVAPIFSEMLNIIVGSSIPTLNRYFEKLTLSPPRVSYGRTVYPSYVSQEVQVDFPEGQVGLTLFLDQTKTDLASSYEKSVASLLTVNQELESANLKLKDQQAKLVHSEKMASLGVLAAGVAHEINNPLAYVDSNFSTLSSYIDTFGLLLKSVKELIGNYSSDEKLKNLIDLQRKEDLSFLFDDTQDLIRESKDGVSRIRSIVKNLRNFSHLDQDDVVESNLNTELESVLKLLKNQLQYQCDVDCNFSEIPSIVCLPKQLNQVFVNLILNSSQAMKTNERGRIEVKTQKVDSFVEIEISDNGVGIEAGRLGQIFDPFYTSKSPGEGTGLGLYISHSIVQKHAGEITVASEVGKGTTFTIRIPADLTKERLEELGSDQQGEKRIA